MTKEEQKQQHIKDSDKAAEVLADLVIMNKIMHDGISEASAIIGRMQLELDEKDKEILLLRQELHRASLTING